MLDIKKIPCAVIFPVPEGKEYLTYCIANSIGELTTLFGVDKDKVYKKYKGILKGVGIGIRTEKINPFIYKIRSKESKPPCKVPICRVNNVKSEQFADRLVYAALAHYVNREMMGIEKSLREFDFKSIDFDLFDGQSLVKEIGYVINEIEKARTNLTAQSLDDKVHDLILYALSSSFGTNYFNDVRRLFGYVEAVGANSKSMENIYKLLLSKIYFLKEGDDETAERIDKKIKRL